MLDINYICPLKLPRHHVSIPPNQRRGDHGFPNDLSIDQAIAYLEEEIRALGVSRATIYSNYDRLNSSRSRSKRDDDAAICCELRLDTHAHFLVCDRWMGAQYNLYALHLAIRAMRNIVKWGVASKEQILAGFDATADPNAAHGGQANDHTILPDWMQVLGLGTSATLEDANATYRRRAKQVANEHDKLLELNQAIEAARHYFGGA